MAKAKSDKPLAGYEVVLAVTGGIACYKSADLASKLIQAGAGVTVAMTEAACQFVQPLTFQALTGRQAYTSMWTRTEEFHGEHISLTDLADLLIVAPATANCLGKFAAGISDDLVSALAMTATTACPILIAPAMNSRMWASPAVRANVRQLKAWGFRFIGPEEGRLACGTTGPGRMTKPADILAASSRSPREKASRADGTTDSSRSHFRLRS